MNYRSYLQIKAADPGSPVGGYTRVLHAAQHDDLFHLIPSILVKKLPASILRDYPPMNRPWALCQFLARVRIPEDYVMMTEPDHILVRPLPLEAGPGKAVVWPFWYVKCAEPPFAGQCARREFNEKGVPLELVPKVRAARTWCSRVW